MCEARCDEDPEITALRCTTTAFLVSFCHVRFPTLRHALSDGATLGIERAGNGRRPEIGCRHAARPISVNNGSAHPIDVNQVVVTAVYGTPA